MLRADSPGHFPFNADNDVTSVVRRQALLSSPTSGKTATNSNKGVDTFAGNCRKPTDYTSNGDALLVKRVGLGSG